MFKKIFPILLLLFFIPLIVKADLGRKPTMDFNFIFKTSVEVDIIDGEQFQCKDKECVDSRVLVNVGPQGLRCKDNRCFSVSYGYEGKYHKLDLQFSDKNRQSNVFKYVAYNSKYNVVVEEDKLVVTDVTSFFEKYNLLQRNFNINA